MSRHRPRSPRLRGLLALAVAASLTGASAAAKPSPGQLHDKIGAAKAREQSLQAGINSDNAHIATFQPRLSSLQARLKAYERSLGIERGLLGHLQTQLRGAQGHLSVLKARLDSGERLLAAQLTAQYEGDTPDGLSVIISSHGFADMLERVDQLRAIAHENAQTVVDIRSAKSAVDAQVARLSDLEGRQARVTAAVLSQRDQVLRLRLAVLARERPFAVARGARSVQLHSIRSRRQALERQLSTVQQQEASARARAFGFNLTGGAPSGNDGFFAAPGTGYSVGSEPAIAARLNTLGKALHIHLIGISGYRSPQHSVEVGGFANDPHTRGEASDTPGVEGVPEAVLNRFGLTRPFAGPAEADHIQLR